MIHILLLTLIFNTPSSAKLTIEQDSGSYILRNTFTIDAPARQVLEVLTDYNHMSEFVPYIERSAVVSTDPFLIVQQTIKAKIWFFTKHLYVTMVVSQSPTRIVFDDTSGISFNTYSGLWEMQDRGTFTDVAYTVEIDPKFRIAPFLAKGALTDSAETFVDLLKKEVKRRNP